MSVLLILLIIGVNLLFISNSDLITIDSFVYIQTICYFITFIVGWTVLNKQIKGPFFHWDFKGSLEIIKQSLPYAALILLMLLYNRSDAVILERIHVNGRIEAGFYAQGFRLLDALYMFGMIFAGLLFPMFSRLLKNAIDEVTPLLQTAGNLLVGGSIVIVTISLFNAQFFLDLLYHNVNSSSVFSFKFLISCFIPICINFIFGTLLTANGNLKTLNVISFSAVVFSIGLNLFIISVGFVENGIAPIITSNTDMSAAVFVDPLPQALVLTAIVIGVGTTALGLALVKGIYSKYQTLEIDEVEEI